MPHKSAGVWNVSGSVRSTYTQDGAVLLDVEKGLCYSLNVVAAKVWNTLEECQPGIAFVKLVDTMRERFDVPREQSNPLVWRADHSSMLPAKWRH